jgi:hypothetical protein
VSRPVFITGAMRSGTTLVQKGLCIHPECDIRFQPFQDRLVDAKRRFLSHRTGDGVLSPFQREYPLNDMFLGNSYDIEELTQYLARAGFDPSKRVVHAPSAGDSETTTGGPDLRESLHRHFGIPQESGGIIGFKEVFCEEYIPYLAASGIRTVLIVRDPRDVLTSATVGASAEYCGRPRPALFTVRQWRKSVAFALAYGDSPAVQVIRYEDLVHNPGQVFGRITSFLGAGPFDCDIAKATLRDDGGRPWKSNSSLAPAIRITTSSVGCHQRHLNPNLRHFVDAACCPEIRALNYETAVKAGDAKAILEDLVLEEPLDRPALREYLWTQSRRDEETERLNRIESGEYSREMFIHKRAFDQLADLESTNRGSEIAP